MHSIVLNALTLWYSCQKPDQTVIITSELLHALACPPSPKRPFRKPQTWHHPHHYNRPGDSCLWWANNSPCSLSIPMKSFSPDAYPRLSVQSGVGAGVCVWDRERRVSTFHTSGTAPHTHPPLHGCKRRSTKKMSWSQGALGKSLIELEGNETIESDFTCSANALRSHT